MILSFRLICYVRHTFFSGSLINLEYDELSNVTSGAEQISQTGLLHHKRQPEESIRAAGNFKAFVGPFVRPLGTLGWQRCPGGSGL